MKANEVHKLSGEEIDVELDRLRRKIFDLRVQTQTEKIEDPSQFSKVRADIARLLTERSARLRAGKPVGGKATKPAAVKKKAPAKKRPATA
jgi:ribosomal protein L29